MPDNKPDNHKLNGVNGKMVFLQEFIKHPFQIGSVIPSSHILEQRIVKAAGVATSDLVVELGPGTGGTSRAILKAMQSHARLLSIEINPHFHNLIRQIDDDRYIAHLGNAHDLRDILSAYEMPAPHAIISGIPFSTISRSAGSRILEVITSVLPTNGRFVAYQARNRVASLCQPYLGEAQTDMVYFNIPPMRIFRWQKNA